MKTLQYTVKAVGEEMFELNDLVKDGTIVPNMEIILKELALVGEHPVQEIMPNNENIGSVVLDIIESYHLNKGEGLAELIDYMFHEGASKAYFEGIENEILTNPIFWTDEPML